MSDLILLTPWERVETVGRIWVSLSERWGHRPRKLRKIDQGHQQFGAEAGLGRPTMPLILNLRPLSPLCLLMTPQQESDGDGEARDLSVVFPDRTQVSTSQLSLSQTTHS